MINNKRFHITNLSELSKQIRDLDCLQFETLFYLEREAYMGSFPDEFSVQPKQQPQYIIIMKLSAIKYNNGIEEYYYNWKIKEIKGS